MSALGIARRRSSLSDQVMVDSSERQVAQLSQWRAPGWGVPLFALAALVLVPWVVVLVKVLPSSQQAGHWDIAWGGFDVALALRLLSVAVAAWRGSPWLAGAAAASGRFLIV